MNIVYPSLYHITVRKHFGPDGIYIENVPGCFKAIFVHDFQRMDYTPHKYVTFCVYDTGLNFSAN